MAKLGIGRRTRQYNPGAGNLAQYVQAAVEHTRGAHDAGGKIIHETPKGKRKAFAREIAFRKGHRNPSIMEVGSGEYQVDNGHGTILTLKKKSHGTWEVHSDNVRARVAWRGMAGVHAFRSLAEVERKYKAFRGIASMIGEKNPKPLAGHPYHSKTDASLLYIIKDAGEAANNMRAMGNAEKEAKYLDQMNDAATILRYRRKNPGGRAMEVTRKFTGGLLKGLTHTEVTTAPFRVGQVVRKPIGGSPYKITAVKPAGKNPMHIVGAKKPGDDRKLIKGAMKLIRATGYHALARQFAEEPDKRERIARTVGGIIEKKHGAARGAQAVELLMAAVNRLKQNPDAGAAELYTKFHGRGPDKSYDIMVPVTDPYTAHPEIAQLGKLLSLTVGEAVKMTGAAGTMPKGTDSEIEGWAEQITFNVKAPDVAAEPGGKQIYFAGGDQNLDSFLEQLGADPTKELLDLGFCYRIEYMTQKKFDQFRPTDYWHLFGEETGVQPRLIYDRRNKLIQLVGGEYVIRPEGIVN